MPRSLSKVVAAALLLKGILMAQPVLASGEPGVIEFLQALKREYADVRIGQMHAPFRRLPMRVEGWQELRFKDLNYLQYTAVDPILEINTKAGVLRLPVIAASYSTHVKGALRGYVLRVKGVNGFVCVAFEDVRRVFSQGNLQIEVSAPDYSHREPGGGLVVVKFVVSDQRSRNPLFEFTFDFQNGKDPEPRCVDEIILRAIAE